MKKHKLVKIYKCRFLRPHSQENMFQKMKEEITSQKNLFKDRNIT